MTFGSPVHCTHLFPFRTFFFFFFFLILFPLLFQCPFFRMLFIYIYFFPLLTGCACFSGPSRAVFIRQRECGFSSSSTFYIPPARLQSFVCDLNYFVPVSGLHECCSSIVLPVDFSRSKSRGSIAVCGEQFLSEKWRLERSRTLLRCVIFHKP